MAVMDALMSWPFAPDRSFCLSSKRDLIVPDPFNFLSFPLSPQHVKKLMAPTVTCMPARQAAT